VYQLAGYALLDWGDRYRLDSVGWYLARQGVLPAWGLTEFLQLLGWGRTLGELRGLTARALGRQSPGAVTPVPPDGAVPGWVVRTAAEIAAVRAAAYRRYAAEPRAAWHGGVVKAIDWVLGTGPGPLTGRRGPVTRWTEDAEVDAARAVIEGTTVAEAWRRSAGAADPPVELLPSLVIDHEWARGVVNACGWLHGGVPVLPGLTDP
jgi:hypothetical protein